jgi:hypothetical protein
MKNGVTICGAMNVLRSEGEVGPLNGALEY